MALIVQKFGGTSVEDMDCIKNVAEIITKTRMQGHQVIAVVSAMGKDTDRLIQLADAFDVSNAREYDALVSTGEQACAALLSMALEAQGSPARSYTGAQAYVLTTPAHKKARIIDIDPRLLLEDTAQGVTPVVAGFQGVTQVGEVTTLGRGGSDITAVALAAAAQADECQIFTDVPGVYTCDPRVVPHAQRISKITFDEIMEMSALGAQVLKDRCLELAGKHRVPIRVLSSFSQEGTLITLDQDDAERPLISGIVLDRNQAKLTLHAVPDRPGLASYILGPISQANIEIDMMVQNAITSKTCVDFSFTLSRADYKEASQLLKRIADELNAQAVLGSNQVAKLSLVGLGIRSHAGIASKMCSSLGQEGVHIHLMTAAETKLSAIIDEKYLELGARTLHRVFGLALRV